MNLDIIITRKRSTWWSKLSGSMFLFYLVFTFYSGDLWYAVATTLWAVLYQVETGWNLYTARPKEEVKTSEQGPGSRS